MIDNKLRESILPLENIESVPTLYIIGNGFDIAHDIKSRYQDFKKFEVDKGEGHFVSMMEIFFNNSTDFWSDVETALGDYEEDSIIDFCNPNPEFDYDHPTRSEAAYVDSPDWIFQPLLDQFKEDFREWVESIDINDTERLMTLSKDSRYLTFNYTETLESIYGIPESKITYIHGKRFVDEEYVVGHDTYCNPDKAFDDDDIMFKQETRAKVIDWMNKLHKDTKTISRNNEVFFDNLSDIRQIYVLGHSLNRIDDIYFNKIIKATSLDIPWVFSFYGSKDLIAINDFATRHGLTNVTAKSFDDLCDLLDS